MRLGARHPVGLAPGHGEVGRLEEARDEGHLELADGLGAGFEVGVERLPLAHEPVGLPPAALARLAGDRHDLRPAVVVDPERVEDLHDIVLVDHVAVLEREICARLCPICLAS